MTVRVSRRQSQIASEHSRYPWPPMSWMRLNVGDLDSWRVFDLRTLPSWDVAQALEYCYMNFLRDDFTVHGLFSSTVATVQHLCPEYRLENVMMLCPTYRDNNALSCVNDIKMHSIKSCRTCQLCCT